ncbi:NAD(P)-binding protein [Aspergillus ambiguus]|uniref:NAD(P)-binding protein n=1 Tax=Aspergillus ambiguus TaxID=176160 RepID=UPI003CCE4306
MTVQQAPFALPPRARILVTGANGFLASHATNELLRLGYRVRGTVRGAKPWLDAFYTAKYGQGNFETVIVEDLGNYLEVSSVLDNVDGIIHLASDVSLTDDVKKAVPLARKTALTILEVASRRASIRRVVIGSSSMAAYSPTPNKKGIVVHENTWNTSAMEMAWNSFSVPEKCADAAESHHRRMTVYSACKMEAEKASWEWFKRTQPSFDLNSVVSSYAVGKILHKEIPGSTMGWVRSLLRGNKTPMYLIPPKWFVDVEDIARLLTVSLLDSTVSSERVFAFSESMNWSGVTDILRKLQPENHSIPSPLNNEGRDLARILPRDRAIRLLQGFYGQSDMTPIATSITKGILEDPS